MRMRSTLLSLREMQIKTRVVGLLNLKTVSSIDEDTEEPGLSHTLLVRS